MGCMDTDIQHLDFVPDGFKYMGCRYCDKPMLVGSRTKKAPHHFECSVKASFECVRQMSAKSGPYYERWRQSMARYAEEIGGGGAGPADPPGGVTPPTQEG